MKNFKKLSTAVAVLAALCSTTSAFAAVEANIGATSNYVWRGVTQTGNAAAISGGIDYSNESGFYAGTWLSTIDFGSGSGVEHDFYLGFGGESGDFGYDVGFALYTYPYTGFEDSDFGEVYFNGSYGAFGFGVAYTAYSQVSDGSLFDKGDIFYNVSYGFDLPEDYSVTFTVGHYDFDFGSDYDYNYLQADISKGDFTLSISKADEESGSDDALVVVSWGTTF